MKGEVGEQHTANDKKLRKAPVTWGKRNESKEWTKRKNEEKNEATRKNETTRNIKTTKNIETTRDNELKPREIKEKWRDIPELVWG